MELDPDFDVHNTMAMIFGADKAVRRLFASAGGWPNSASEYFNSTIAEQYSALRLSVAGFEAEISFEHPLATPNVNEAHVSL